MQKKRVVILGAGISGLATAWYLSRTGLPLDITILEKSPRIGGWMHTDHTMGFHFEKGPRTFKVDKCPHLIRLIADLQLEDRMIWSEAKPHHRYLWLEGELHRFPTNPVSFLFSPLTQGFLRALLMEWKRPTKEGDETVWEFVLRRFNYDVARLFFDPMVVGIFGGDIRQISIRACFPILKKWEEEFGSVTKGFFYKILQKRKSSKFSLDIPQIPLSAVFSFQEGVEALPQFIAKHIPASIKCETEAKQLLFENGQVVVCTNNGQHVADYLFSALPVKETGHLFESHAPQVAKEFINIPSIGVAVVNFGYDADVLPVQGFGYLTATYAHEDILGVVFDSSVFKEHNQRPQETRLTIKLEETGRSEEKYVEAAFQGLRRHLGISQRPKAISFKRAARAIPQYRVGHLDQMAALSQQFSTAFPQCFLVGNYLSGVSVDSCIQRAQWTVQEFANIFVPYNN